MKKGIIALSATAIMVCSGYVAASADNNDNGTAEIVVESTDSIAADSTMNARQDSLSSDSLVVYIDEEVKKIEYTYDDFLKMIPDATNARKRQTLYVKIDNSSLKSKEKKELIKILYGKDKKK